MIALRPRLRPNSAPPIAMSLALAVTMAAPSGCSWLIDVDRTQCEESRDCQLAGLTGTCEQGVCVELVESDPPCDGGECEMGQNADGGAGSGGEPDPGGESCLGSMRCDDGEICFKDQCVMERDVARFVCEESAPEMTPTVHFTMPVREFVSEKPPADLVVRACRASDVSCTDPVAMFEDEAGTGMLVLDLPYGFSGFLELRSPETLTSLWYFTEPLIRPTDAKVLKAVAPSTLTILASVTGYAVEKTKGLVILEAFDCAKNAVGGIHFEESKAESIPFFIIDGLPNTESTVTVRDEMENQAVGGFVNATPGFTVFTARIGVDGTLLGKFNANVRANTVTYLDIHP